jgi:hypothetical protein
MGLVTALIMIVLGILGAASLIIAKKPDAKELIDKLAPYQGYVGAVGAIWGVWTIINSVLTMGTWLANYPIWWATYLATGVVMFALGLLLGVGILKTWIKDAKAQQKMDELIQRLAPKQGMLGVVSIGLGVWTLVASFILL